MSLSYLITSRSRFRSSITRIYTERDDLVSADDIKRKNTKIKLERLSEELSSLNEKVADAKFSDKYKEEDLEKELEACEQYDDKICECLSLLAAASAPPPRMEEARSLLKSPVAPLPRFNTDEGENLELFLRQFEETLSKFKYTDYDKLILLKQQIFGKASVLIDSLDADKQTYAEAKSLLVAALASKPVQKFNVLKQLSGLKLTYSSEPFQYMSDMRKIMQAVKHLEMTMDDVMQYFFLDGLNDSFKNHLVLVTNNSKPTLKEIMDNFFIANERYAVSQTSFKSKFKSENSHKVATNVSLAIKTDSNVEVSSNPFSKCPLCPKGDHPVNRCVNYADPQSKLIRLQVLGGCSKCANVDHGIDRCKFRFKKPCNICSAWHFTFLCPNKPKLESANKSAIGKPLINKELKTQNTVVVANYFQASNYSIESILPTFTCAIGNVQARGLKDSGSQCNFICESLLSNCDYELVKDEVELTLNGINETRLYMSKLIRAKVMFGLDAKTVDFLTIPDIKVSLSLPGLSTIVSGFVDKGYKMADQTLLTGGDIIGGISLILGANAANCFHDSTTHFGESSVFVNTQFGVILYGNVDRMLLDLHELPCVRNTHALTVNTEIDEYKPSSEPLPVKNESVTLAIDCVGFPLNSSSTPTKLDRCHEYSLSAKGEDVNSAEKSIADVLNEDCSIFLNKDAEDNTDLCYEVNSKLVNYLIENTTRNEEGRLIMPLLWNDEVKHLLSNNFNLAKSILHSNLKKLLKNKPNLYLVDNNIKDLESAGMIEKVSDIYSYLEENPNSSFLPHMPIFKPNKETTKVRMVFLSNMCEKTNNGNAISHNQAMFAGPCVNQKLTVALILLRFDPKLLCFDLKKAFLQIELQESDRDKLLFLWYKNVEKEDFTLQAFRNVRLSFGLRCSPTILMIGLYIILMLNSETDAQRVRVLKRLVYALIYMDNGAVTMESSDDLIWAYNQLDGIFNPYQFHLQQFCTNDEILRPQLEETETVVDLFGLKWDTNSDVLYTKKKHLDETAKTKRNVLKTIAENFDPYNFEGPMLNRARLFLHSLQVQTKLGWDTQISSEQVREWNNISKQVNASSPMAVPRFVGNRNGKYKLICFTDSSKLIYGAVVFIQDLSNNKVSFLLAKNKLVNKTLESKSIPTLEFMGIVLGAETLLDLRKDLCGSQCVCPIDVTEMILYSDSLVCLSWINSFVNKFDKMNKQSILILNKLERLTKICKDYPIIFTFVDGIENPADAITRPLSHRQLLKSNYLVGPDFLVSPDYNKSRSDILRVTIPNPILQTVEVAGSSSAQISHAFPVNLDKVSHLVPLEKFSGVDRFLKVHEKVFGFINKLKLGIKRRNPDKYRHLVIHENVSEVALEHVLKVEQLLDYHVVFDYFDKKNPPVKEIPNVVLQLNVFVDERGLLRVGSKIPKNRMYNKNYFPILLSKTSVFTSLMVQSCHEKISHSGVYSVLNDVRKKYWIPHCFSVVKRVLKACVHCRRYNSRTVKLNQSDYRSFRLNPTNVPFSSIFLDHMGPFFVKINQQKVKVWILVITCLWTRAINLKLSLDLGTEEFIRAFQLHAFEFGLAQLVLSDAGTQIVAGAKRISNFLDDSNVRSYFKENNAEVTTFEQYYKGCSKLGSLVESCVKMTKRLLAGSIKLNVLNVRDFEFFVAQTVHLVNRRPVAFRDSLRDCDGGELPEIITPELLIHGHNLLSANVIPSLQSVSETNGDPDFQLDPDDRIKRSFTKLCKVRANLIELYNSEFLVNLIGQATNNKSRYKPVSHAALRVGDVVLLKEQFTKPTNYPMGIIKELNINDLGEVTGATVLKGSTREIVKRHSSVIIPLLTNNEMSNSNTSFADTSEDTETTEPVPRRTRLAAVESARKTREMLDT